LLKAAIFDAYGTLLDVNSATRRLVQSDTYPQLAAHETQLSAIWRTKQLHYSWLRSLMGAYVPFWQCTSDALDYALAETGLDGDSALRNDLLALYRKIDAYDDAKRLLQELTDVPTAILSNGNYDMLRDATQSAGIDSYLDKILSVEDVGIFKPSRKVYQMGCDAFDVKANEVLFFSSNGWDIAGARHFGYHTIWVNRTGQTQELLGDGPHHIVSDLDEAGQLARDFLEE